jgi:hypothetical protein
VRARSSEIDDLGNWTGPAEPDCSAIDPRPASSEHHGEWIGVMVRAPSQMTAAPFLGIRAMNRNSYTHELIGFLEARTRSGDSAFDITKQLEATLAALLCRDFGLGRLDAEQRLHDIVRALERALHAEMSDRLHIDDAIDAVHQIFGDD